jgi:hypothetical protein
MAEVTTAAASSLLASLVDYAGLFPPAGLEMEEAVEEYARHRRSPERWILGRFVVPARRLTEMETAAAPYLPTLGAADPWRISALLGSDAEADVAQAVSLGHRLRGQAVVDSVELKAATPAEIEAVLAMLPPRLTAYVEVPIDADLAPLLSALKGRGARAKVRTGGVTPDAIPPSAKVARLLVACAAARVPFKATAGLHHALRGTRRLTYAADSPTAAMHGFLNVFAAAGLAWLGAPADAVEAVLQEENAEAIRVDARGLSAGDQRLSSGDVAACRTQFAMGFGSCSFVEPVADLKALGIL